MFVRCVLAANVYTHGAVDADGGRARAAHRGRELALIDHYVSAVCIKISVTDQRDNIACLSAQLGDPAGNAHITCRGSTAVQLGAIFQTPCGKKDLSGVHGCKYSKE